MSLHVFKGLFFVLFCLQAQNIWAQADTAQALQKEGAFLSPYLSLRTFLEVLHSEEKAYKQIAPLFAHPEYNTEARIAVARHLKQILDGLGVVIYLEEVPQDADYKDSLTAKHRYVLLSDHPGIYLERQAGKWLFPARVVDEIEAWHSRVFPLGMDRLVQWLPQLGSQRFGPLYLWQWIALLLLIAVSVVLHKGFTFFTERMLMRFLLKQGYTQLAHKHLLPVARPFSWILVSGLLWLLLPILQLPVRVAHYVMIGLQVMLPVFFAIMLYYFVDILHIYLMRWAQKTQSTLDDQLIMLLRKILKIFVVVLGGLLVMDNLNIPIVPLLTGLSLGGLAFALAAQDTIKNFFGSLMIFIDKPFQIGDWITCGDIDGTVEEVGFRSTRVRTFRNSLIYVPNAKLADSMVDNHGLRKYRRYYAKLCIPYETSVNSIEAFVEGLRNILQTHPQTLKERHEIHLHDFTKEGLVVMFYVFIEAPNWSQELSVRHELNISILQLAEKLNIKFAYALDLALSTRALQAPLSFERSLKKSSSVTLQKKLTTLAKKVKKK